MLLTQRMAEHYDDLADLFWFISADADNEIVFTYDIEACELWDELQLWGEDDVALPVATPKTLEQARSIIESKGYTIA